MQSETPENGENETKIHLNNGKIEPKFYCYCEKEGKYYQIVNYWVDTYIYVYKSYWSYNKESKTWSETCASAPDMQRSYNHEIKHYNRAVDRYAYYCRQYMYEETNLTKSTFPISEEICNKEGEIGIQKLEKVFTDWRILEALHKHSDSPKVSKKRDNAICPN